MLADRDDLEQLGRVGVEVDHVGRILGSRGPTVHRQSDVGLGECRSVVRAVTGHRDEVALGLLRPDERDLLLGRGLRDEVVDAGLLGDGRRGARIVAGDHHGADAHPAELGEALDESLLDGVLEFDHAEDTALAFEDEWRGAEVGDPVSVADDTLGQCADLLLDRVDRALQDRDARRRLDSARAGLGTECDLLDDGLVQLGERGIVADTGRAAELGQALACQVDDGAALRRLVPDRRHEGGFDSLRLRDAAAGVMDAARRLP